MPALDAGRSTVRTLILAQAVSYFDVLEMLGDAAWELVTASIQPTSFALVLKRERTTGCSDSARARTYPPPARRHPRERFGSEHPEAVLRPVEDAAA